MKAGIESQYIRLGAKEMLLFGKSMLHLTKDTTITCK